MASIISAGTTSGTALNMTGDTSGQLQLATGATATTAVTIDASQNVGIGTTSPIGKLSVAGGSGPAYASLSQTGDNPYLEFERWSGTASNYGGARIKGLNDGSGNGGIITFETSNLNTIATQTFTERMRIDTSGNVLVGTTTSSGKTTILQSTNASALSIGNENTIDGGYYGVVQITRPGDQTGNAFHLAFVRNGNKIAGMGFLDNSNTFAIQNANDNTGAGVTLTSGATSWGTTSDERKKDIVGNIENALSKISDWRCVYYKYKSDEQNTQQRVGLVAQDVQKTLPEAISIEEDELQTLQLRYTETIPVLVKSIQEQQTIINDLKARIETLEGGK